MKVLSNWRSVRLWETHLGGGSHNHPSATGTAHEGGVLSDAASGALEVAFSYVSARAAVRVAREGWLMAAVRLTWKPLLGAVLCAVVLGAALDRFMPEVNSLPEAVRTLLKKH
jgi:hypothetical protein